MNGIIETLESRTLLAVTGFPFKLGSSGFDMGKRIEATPDGGYVVAGLFGGTVDFDPSAGVVNVTSRGDTDIYVAKFSATSTLEWVKTFGDIQLRDGIRDQDEFIDVAAKADRAGGEFINGVSADPRDVGEYINDLAVGPDGQIYFSGYFYGQIDFDPGRGQSILINTDNDYPDAFVVKLKPNGGLTWARRFGDRFTEIASAIAIDPGNNILVTGFFARDVNFVPGDPSFQRHALGRADAYLMKLSASGRVVWVNTFGGEGVDHPDIDAGRDVAVDAAGNAYVVGTFADKNVDFDPTTRTAYLSAADKTDGFLAKYDTNGRFRYAASVGGGEYDSLTHVAVDSAGDIILAGFFEDRNVDVTPGSGSLPRLSATPERPGRSPKFIDAYVQKLSRGGVAWTRQITGTGTEFIEDLKLDSADNIIVGGAFYGTATFGSAGTMTSVRGVDDFKDDNDDNREQSYDGFLWKLEPGAGGTQFVRPLGAAGDDYGMGVGITSDDQILFTGRFRGTVDFDPGRARRNVRALGFADAFLTAYDQDGRAALS